MIDASPTKAPARLTAADGRAPAFGSRARQSGLGRTAILIGAGVALLAAGTALMMMNGGAESSSDEPQVTPNEQISIDSLDQQLTEGRIEEAENFYSTAMDPQRIPPREYERLIGSLVSSNEGELTREGLFLYSQMLTDIARYEVDFSPGAYQEHVRRMRHQAISRGEGKELYFVLSYRLMEYEDLAQRFPILQPDIIDFHILFGDRVPEIDDELPSERSHWEQALDALPALIERQRTDPSPNLDERYYPLRALARVFAQTRSEQALALFEDTLGRLGDGSPEDLASFGGWFGPAIGERDRAPWTGAADPNSYYGYDSEIAFQLRHWLVGIARYYRPGDGLERGSRWIARALDSVDFGPHYLFKLDLALTLRDEANRLEAMLKDETSVSGRDRGRQLYEIGYEAIRRGDREELSAVIYRLEDSALLEVQSVRELLRGASEILLGNIEEGRDHIAARLEITPEMLSPTEIEAWRGIADNGKLPVVEDAEFGRSLLTSGVLWDDLREHEQLQRIVRLLGQHLSRPEDLYYMRYLEAVLAYRASDVDGLEERMLELLDLESPPGITRSDIAGLAAAVDTRVDDIRSIEERRRRALDDLIPDVLRGVPDRSSVIELAAILDWQLRMDTSDATYLQTEEGHQAIRSIMTQLADEEWLDFRLEEKWLELEEDLLMIARRHREEGAVDLARDALSYSKRLHDDHPVYRAENARILEVEAQRVSRSQPKERSAAWKRVGDAYLEAATAEFGDREFLFDAGLAYLEAEEFLAADEVLEAYMPHRGRGAEGEHRYWARIIARSEIARRTGRPAKAIDVLDEITDFHGAETYRARLGLERAWALADLARHDDALAAFDAVLNELVDPNSPDYVHALYGKAQLLQARHGRYYGDPKRTEAERQEALNAAHRVWEDLAHKISPQSGDARLAEALYLSGVGWIERGDFARAREYFSRVAPAHTIARRSENPPSDLADWHGLAVKAAHAHAEAYFLEDRYSDAVQMYNAAIAVDPDSPEIALAFHQLGLSWFHLDDFDEARRFWELGRARVNTLEEERLAELPLRQDKQFWIALYDEKLDALDNPDRLRSQ